SFDVVNEQLEISDPIDLSEDRLLNVTQKDGCRVIIYGSLDGGKNGPAVGIISAEQVYAVYEGEWTRGVPDGFGKVIIWNKDETYSDAIIMNGEMDRGVLSGTSEITGDGFRKVEFEVEKGVFGDVGKDKDGASYEIKTGDDVNDQSYAAGVPGYWASDIKPELIPVN
ncbi:MAG: hypothetical protein IJV16_02120, partial [Lachnospiraceae bacterium]|nr:hypothetical protein [Lachnospiraceae bacterium]